MLGFLGWAKSRSRFDAALGDMLTDVASSSTIVLDIKTKDYGSLLWAEKAVLFAIIVKSVLSKFFLTV